MGIMQFFRALLGFDEPRAAHTTEEHAPRERTSAKGKGVASGKRVVIVTMSNEIRLHLSEHLQPLVEAKGYSYDDHPNINSAVSSQIIVLDGRPDVDAKLHGKYDKILRIKKAMGKNDDITCVIGPRNRYKKYPRGTYPRLYYFCVEANNMDHREPDLTPEGQPTIEGPTLYNIADLPEAIAARISDLSGPSLHA